MHPGLGTNILLSRPCSLSTASYLLPSDTHMSTLSRTSLEVPLWNSALPLGGGTYSILLGELRCHVKIKWTVSNHSHCLFLRREAGSEFPGPGSHCPPFPPWQRVSAAACACAAAGPTEASCAPPGCGASNCASAVERPVRGGGEIPATPTDKHRLIVLVGMCQGSLTSCSEFPCLH